MNQYQERLVKFAFEHPDKRDLVFSVLNKKASSQIIEKALSQQRQRRLQYDKDLLDLKARHEQELKDLRDSYEEDTDEIRKEVRGKVGELRDKFLEEFQELHMKKAEALSKIRVDMEEEIKKVVAGLQEEVEKGTITEEEMLSRRPRLLADVQRKYDLEIKKFNIENAKKAADLRAKYKDVGEERLHRVLRQSLLTMTWDLKTLVRGGISWANNIVVRKDKEIQKELGQTPKEELPVAP